MNAKSCYSQGRLTSFFFTASDESLGSNFSRVSTLAGKLDEIDRLVNNWEDMELSDNLFQLGVACRPLGASPLGL